MLKALASNRTVYIVASTSFVLVEVTATSLYHNPRPVGEEQESDVLERGYASVSSDDSNGSGFEYAYDSDDSNTGGDRSEYVLGDRVDGSGSG